MICLNKTSFISNKMNCNIHKYLINSRLLQARPLNVEYLMMDESILLPPTGTPLTGIDFIKRLPSGQMERTRRVSEWALVLRYDKKSNVSGMFKLICM